MKRKVTIIKYKKANEMKKITALIFALILTLGLVGCNGKRSISTSRLRLKMSKALKCTTTTECPHRQKRK